jgi:hypothetical protein
MSIYPPTPQSVMAQQQANMAQQQANMAQQQANVTWYPPSMGGPVATRIYHPAPPDYWQNQVHCLSEQLHDEVNKRLAAERDAKMFMELHRYMMLMHPDLLTEFQNYLEVRKKIEDATNDSDSVGR